MSNKKEAIHSDQAPAAIGCYSPAILAGSMLYLSGQIPLDPSSMQLVEGDIAAQIKQVFANLQAVAHAAGASLDDVVKLTVYLIDITNSTAVNEAMLGYFTQPFPARTTIQVVALPKGAQVEVDAILSII